MLTRRRRARRGVRRAAAARAGGVNWPFAGVLAFAVLCAAVVGVSGVSAPEAPEPPPPDPGEHEVERVLDGDTIVLTDGRRVRLAQIDAPEVSENECFAEAARAALRAILPVGSRISLRRDPRLDRVDRFGRLIRYVIARRANVNVELVRRGAASVWFVDGERGRRADALLRAVRSARRHKAGLWRTCPRAHFDPAFGVDSDGRWR